MARKKRQIVKKTLSMRSMILELNMDVKNNLGLFLIVSLETTPKIKKIALCNH